MTKEDLIPGNDYKHEPAIYDGSKPLAIYTFVGFNKVGNCIWKPVGELAESEFTVTITYTLTRFKTI